jgi:hypothetical protein
MTNEHELELYVVESSTGEPRYYATNKAIVEKYLKRHPELSLRMETLRCTQRAWDAMCELAQYGYTVH